MKKPVFLLVNFLAAMVSCSTLLGASLPEKHPLDKSESRTLVLENGLRVALISDPALNLASASMAVEVGSYANPKDAQGLAHFLEHMLFLGTEKYPDASEYNAYLQQNGGYPNAYTSTDLTNYHFEVYPVAFEGALDRFSQFFIAPLFTSEFTEREMNAVDSEFEKNREDDQWRSAHLFNMAQREDHPQHQFSTGNRDTLKTVTRETLIDFYQEFYSANQMALALVSPTNLDVMEAWVRTFFSNIRSQERDRLHYPSDPLPKLEALRLMKIQTKGDRRDLVLYFPVPGLENDWDAKTSNLVGQIVGYEGEGSLLSDLKAAGLASSLNGSAWPPTRDYAWLNMTVGLTPAGLENYEQVIQMILGYFKAIRAEPFPAYIYEEMATMARLNELYSDKGEGARRATLLANRVLKIPLAYAVRSPYLFLRQDPELYATLLDAVSPDNMLVSLLSRTVETDQVEPVYGTHYSYEEITGSRYDALVNAPILPQFTLPAPNPFVPDQVDMVSERPVKLIDRPDLTLFYGQDTTFRRPKVSMTFRFRPVWENISVRDNALLDLLQAGFLEAVNETGYAARSAGANYSLAANFDQISLSLSGYTESVEALSSVLVAQLSSFELSQSQFDRVKDRLLRDWNNTKFGNAFRFIRLYQRKVMEEGAFLPWEKASATSDLTLDDMYAFREQLFANGRLEALVYGNISAVDAIERVETAVRQLAFETVPADQVYKTHLLALRDGRHLLFEDFLPGNNSCFRKDIVVGTDNPHDRMVLSVASNLLNAPYMAELRTRQQLGYVVWSGNFLRDDRLNFSLLIQSADYDPAELYKRSEAFAADFPALLEAMPEENFIQAITAVRGDLEKKPTSIAETANEFAALAFDYNEEWDRKESALEVLQTITREDVIGLVKRIFDTEATSSATVYLYARQHADSGQSVDGVEDIQSWMSGEVYKAPL